ncbi:LOW QUALITY PROTEIN: glutathione hydrolase 1 proenzyme [Drosophila tropicalis]|uniref:LOW QUALITY PROTEIN: glutathione hydrolase 1 proenzyme n=1 Tax=Drosophila tropicalis TaxID=46794 RepID=UPI0035AC24C9
MYRSICSYIRIRLLALLALLFAIYLHNQTDRSAVHLAPRRPPNPVEPLPPSHSVLHEFRNAAICSDNSVCSDAARSTLESGGSVVDGALTALFCNGLVGMQSMGLGGGMLMNVYMHEERKSFSILGREMAPASLLAENFTIFRSEQKLKQSSWAIAVPTELKGYAVAHQRFGKLPWSDLIRPTVDLCRRGYPLYKHQLDALILNQDMIRNDELLQKMFINPKTGKFWHMGRIIRPPAQLCTTYQRLAKEGWSSFYNGSLHNDILADLRDMGSAIDASDLSAAEAELRESIVMPLDEFDLHLIPPPGSGLVLGFIMNILRAFRKDFARVEKLGALEVHRIVEALKFGFVKRWQLDPSADKNLIDEMLSSDLAATISKQIDDLQTHNNSNYYGATADTQARKEHGTSHISVFLNGDAVSVTSSINFYFGSGRMGQRTGVLFNNAMSDFSIKHLRNYFDLPYVSGKNTIIPLARPMSSMSPVLVTERSTGRVRLSVGAAGGTRIISTLVPLLIRILWQDSDIKVAIDANRFHHQMFPNVLFYEYGLLQTYVNDLQSKGHHCERYLNRGSVMCGITSNTINGTISVNSDYRKIGGVAGF